ncbi:MAG: DUF1987 domain-containing protein [Flavobacteriales bacterium]|nr:DUF1987 domain-containing protein [Flavobacteriales bacterium]
MKVLNIDPTECSPGVLMDPGANTFVIWGESRPEDAREFYLPILNWMDEYQKFRYWKDDQFSKGQELAVFEFKFEYLNSTSAKFILDLLIKIGNFQEDKMDIKVHWYYDEEDLDMKESGELFETMCNVTFEYLSL